MKTLAVIGAGAFGTSLALVLSKRFDEVRLWAHENELVESMRVSRENDVFLPGFKLAANIG